MNIQQFKDNLGNLTFYNAVLEDHNGNAYLDMPTARTIWMANLKRIRNAKLSKLDVLSLIALESNDQEALAQVIAKKTILREMKNTYDLSTATTWQELLTMWPDYLLQD